MRVDLAVEFVGLKETIDQAVRSVRVGGRTVIVGLGPETIFLPPPTTFVRTELSFFGSYDSTMLEIQYVVDLFLIGKLDLSDSITIQIALEIK